MALSPRFQNTLLGALAVLAVGASGYAVWVVNQPHPSLSDGVTATAPTPTPAPGAGRDDETEATAEPGADTEVETVTEEPPEPEPVALSTQGWLEALGGDEAALQVIGDGYSNMDWQWLQQWAGILGQERPVEIRHWGEAADETYNPPVFLSEADGPSLTVWSASRAGSSIADARQRLDRFEGEADAADAVLVSLGGSSEGEDVADEMEALLADLPEVPVLLVIAPEGLYPAGVADALTDWAQEHPDRVVVVDLRDTGVVDPSAEQWALTFHEALTDRVAQDG